MAKTLTAGKALEIVAVKFPRITADGVGARFASEVRDYMWYAYPWKISLGDLQPFALTQNQADYGSPLFTLPTDFYGLHDVWIRSVADDYVPLSVVKELPVSGSPGYTTTVAITENGKIRLHPRPVLFGPDWWVEGKYKKSTTSITPNNVTSTILPWDDMYFEVFRRGLIWKYRDEIMGDPRAVEDLNIFLTWLGKMIASESGQDGVTPVHPSHGLAM